MSQTNYAYVALDRRGVKCRGVAKAATEVDAFRQISAGGLTPVSIKPVRERRAGKRRRISLRDVAHFTYQLGVLIGARIPIGEGLRSIAEQEPPGRFQNIIWDIATRIEAGSRIADALAEHRTIFGDLYVETVRAAEQTGNLIHVLEYLSDMIDRSVEVRQQLRSALMYPICVLTALAAAVFCLLGFVVPRFAKLFTSRNVELPIFTRILIDFGWSVQNFWWAYLLGIAALVVFIRSAWRRPHSRAVMEKALHRIPFIRTILTGVAVARFARVFGLCIGSGLGLIESIQMAGNASARPMMQRDAERMVEQVRAGGRLSNVMVTCEYLPPFAKRMLASGEESAELKKMCGVIARHYEREAASLTKNISTVIEPVLIVLIAAVVLFVALAIFLPMWDMVKLMG